MAKKLNDIAPLHDDDDDMPELDMTKPIGVQANARIFGKVDLPEEGREIVKPLLIGSITPDPAQPRKIVPVQVIKAAAQDDIPVWQAWHRIAEQMQGETINLKNMLKGESDGLENDPKHAIVKGFMGLVALAADIARIGQTNAITVVRIPGPEEKYALETGERRWLAHKMLYGVTGKEKFNKIKARIVERFSIWRQASENGARDKLTAIAKARQIALLLMDWYHENRGIEFLPYRELVPSVDVCDRLFYAQAKPYKVPDGQGESFLQAVDLPSKTQLSRYRALLEASDELWVRADEEDWPEGKIRAEMEAARLPIGNHSDKSISNHPAPRTPMTIKKGQGPGTPATGDRVLYRGKEVEYVDSEARGDGRGLDVLIFHIDANGNRDFTETVHSRELQDIPSPHAGSPTSGIDYNALPRTPYPSQPPQMPPLSYDVIGKGKAGRVEVGQQRRNTILNRVFEVMSIRGAYGMCFEVNIRTGERLTPSTPFEITLEKLLEMELVDKNAFSASPAPDFSAKQAAAAIFGEDDETEETADNPPSAKPDMPDHIPPPPDWAARGKSILHTPSNTVCTIEGTSWDDLENQWYVRVKNGVGDWADLPVKECIPAIEEAAEPAPIVRHPALEPKNMSNVITELQYDLEPVRAMAASLNMQGNASQITRWKTTTPKALNAFMQQGGIEGAQAELDGMLQSVSDVLNTVWEKAKFIHSEHSEVLRQMAAEKRGA